MHRFPKSGYKSILGVDIKFIKVDKVGNGKYNGMCHADDNMIEIESGLSRKLEQQTIVHETLHMLSDKLNLCLNHTQIHGITTGYMSIKDGKK